MSIEYPVTLDQFRDLLRSHVRVNQATVACAKSMILSEISRYRRSCDFVTWIAEQRKKRLPPIVHIHPSIDCRPQALAIGEYLTDVLSAAEALSDLIHKSFYMPTSDQIYTYSFSFNIFLGFPGSGGYPAVVNPEEFTFALPDHIRACSSSPLPHESNLHLQDLFINELMIANMHTDVIVSLKESLECFRADLFTAAIAMLGKASEGAWLELGRSLVDFTPKTLRASIKNQENILNDPTIGTMKKIDAVIIIYQRADICGDLQSETGIKPRELEPARQWSDNVRDSRNTIHFGVSPAIPLTYDVACNYILGAPRPLRTLYAIKAAADQHQTSPTRP